MGEMADFILSQNNYMGPRKRYFQRENYITGLKVFDKCPECGGMIDLKTNGRNGHKFLGCTNYPNCDVVSDYE